MTFSISPLVWLQPTSNSPSPSGHSRISALLFAPSQLEGPSPSLTFLGIVLDCERHEARLPEDKLSEIRAPLMATISERSIGQRQLESLLGKLTFAARVIVPGHTFMREL